MTQKIRASVIIPVKNGGQIFEKVLNKVLEQELRDGTFEIIIIDSGSSDGSVEFVRSKMNKRNNVRLLQIEPREFGHGKTRNLGASRAKGEILVFLTQDALPYDNYWLENLLVPFEIDDNIAGVFGRHIPYDDCDIFEKELINRHFQGFGEEITVHYLEDKQRYKLDEGYRHMLCFYSDNSSAMRKSIWKKIPYPDVDFAEDQLWAKQIIERGYKKAYTPYSIVYHSHRYSFREQFRRYYDEYRGLNNIYNYIPVKSVFLIPIYICKHWFSDMCFLFNQNILFREKIKWSIYSILKNTNRYLGAYLGVKGNRFNILNKIFSREYRIINGDREA
ncbi:rhamnosyltransferase [Anoxybacillus tepidamans]|uniref:Rhamnosyltransferase n=1 Tax=Anoxybacteroides tepidamans TaxID=265948 RepID=A0A7W8IP79_9BACL|nr:glycosyltransferase [Anoxybacillus tepidamans]MBB5324203.1 rhamnosyltransferase [Anoxybacillus tepidamans]